MDVATLTVSPQGQITIPKAWRKLLNLRPGSKLMGWMVGRAKDRVLALKPAPKSWAEHTLGIAKGAWDDVGGPDAYLAKERDSWERK